MIEQQSLLARATAKLNHEVPENPGHAEEFTTNPKRAWAREIGTVITNLYTNSELGDEIGNSEEWENFQQALEAKAEAYGIEVTEWENKLKKLAGSVSKKFRDQN